MLNPFLMNLGLAPVYDPFPHENEERYDDYSIPGCGLNTWRGEARMAEALNIIKEKPGVTNGYLMKKMGVCESHVSKITRRLRDGGKIRSEWSGAQQEPRKWYAV